MLDHAHQWLYYQVKNFDAQSIEFKFDVYQHAKNQLSSLTSFLRYCKDTANFLFWRMFDHPHQKSYYHFAENFYAKMHSKNHHSSTLSFTSFLRYYKEIANLFWVIWVCLATHKSKYNINLKTLKRTKIYLHPSHSPWDIAKILQLVIWGTLGMPAYT